MSDETFLDFVRGALAAWINPRQAPLGHSEREPPRRRGGLIQFSTILPNMSPAITGMMGEDYGGSPTRLGRLIGHYGDEVWVYVAVSKVAQAAASVPLRARRGKAVDEKSQLLEAGPLVDLLERPNPYQSHFD